MSLFILDWSIYLYTSSLSDKTESGINIETCWAPLSFVLTPFSIHNYATIYSILIESKAAVTKNLIIKTFSYVLYQSF